MADLGASSWSEIDASNDAIPPDGWPEGMQPSDVNNSARSQMGGEKRWWDRSNATQTTTGTSTAYVLTYAATQAALYNGEETSFVLHATNGAAATLNRDALGAKALRKYDLATGAYIALTGGEFLANQVLRVRYNLSADRYDVISAAFAPGDFVTLAGDNDFTGAQTFEQALAFSAAAVIGTRSALDVDQRTAVADAAHAVASTDYTIVYTSLSASRLVTLPAASTFNAGRRLVIMDGSGSASQSVALSLAPNGTDTIAGSNTTQVCVNVARGACVLVCNGATGWDVEKWSVRYVNVLSGDVAMNSTASYFDGPSTAQGTVGTWRAYGQVEVAYVNGGAVIDAKLWDGTTVIQSATITGQVTPPANVALALSGILTTPGANIRISARNETVATGSIVFNASGNSKDSTLTVERIA